ncbi:MAG: hypothetical protein H6712_02545 [Myxococcales bacterium]|nr:hypothetical protein [Myxococcales bacterium]MCB9712708.1 hypothetical protein [Myxococcales bacterium]
MLVLGLGVALAPLRPAIASPWSVPGIVAAAAEPSPEALLEQAQRALDEGRFRESGDRAAEAYAALPLANRASPYGENAVLQASSAYREAWVRDGDDEALEAALFLLQQHVDDYATHGEREAPAHVIDELLRWERLQERCRATDSAPEVSAPEAPVPAPTPSSDARERILRRTTVTTLVGGAALSLGAAVLSAYVFGYGPATDPPDGTLERRTSVGHLAPAIPLGLAGAAVSGLGVHALVATGRTKRRPVGIALTAVGAAGAVLGAALLGAGARYWPQPNDDGLTVIGRANLSVNLQSVGLAVMLGSLGILGPGIGALATREPAGAR